MWYQEDQSAQWAGDAMCVREAGGREASGRPDNSVGGCHRGPN